MVKELQITCKNKRETVRITCHLRNLRNLTGKRTKIVKIKCKSLLVVALERLKPNMDTLPFVKEHVWDILSLSLRTDGIWIIFKNNIFLSVSW